MNFVTVWTFTEVDWGFELPVSASENNRWQGSTDQTVLDRVEIPLWMWSRTSRELIEWYPSVNSISHFSSIVLILFIYFFLIFLFCWKKENDSTKWHRCSDRTENLDDDGRFGQLWQSGECDKNGGLEEIKGNVRCGYCIWRRTVRSLWLVQLGYSPVRGLWLVRYLLLIFVQQKGFRGIGIHHLCR